MGFLHDGGIGPDTRDVLDASSFLQISEFRLFELAYLKWFGESAETKRLESFYAGYMFSERCPFWVRQFCREVAARQRAGTLDPADFGVFPSMDAGTSSQRAARGVMVVVLVGLTLHLVWLLAGNY